MNFIKFTIYLLILNIFALGVFAQNNPKVELFQEFENPTDEYIRAVLDSFYLKLNEDPNARGYILSYGTPQQISRNQGVFRESFKMQRFDASRILLISGGEREKLLTQIWFVPAGADPATILDTVKITSNGCSCPTVSVAEPAESVEPGDTMTFTASVSGSEKDELTYNWSVDKGLIISGQGTPVIIVDTSGLEYTAINVTVNVSSGCPVCENTFAGAGFVRQKIKPELVDKFQRANCEDVLSRMDNFMIQMDNNPNSSGYVITYGKRRLIAGAEREMRNWIKIRGFYSSRITFVSGGGIGDRADVEMWLVPPGADLPEVAAQDEYEAPPEPKEPLAAPTKPYIFLIKYYDGIAGCNDEFDLNGYAEALKENPKSRGNIVIYEATRSDFRRVEKEILDELLKSGIARKRLKTFHIRIEPNRLQESIEIWFLP